MARPKLSERELDLMQVFWKGAGVRSVAEVQEALAATGRDLAFTTVQTMLERLTAKGHVRRRMEGRSWRYSATVKAPTAARAALRSLVEHFFDGSTAELAAHLVEEEMSEADLKRVERLLDERRGRR